MRVNLHIYPSHFQFESRIVKQTKAISDLGIFDQIIILAFWKEGLEKEQKIDDFRSVVRIESFFESRSRGNKLMKLLGFFELLWKSLFYFKKVDLALINCHSLTVLPLSVAMKWFHNSKLCYDTHELETERNGLSGVRKKIEGLVESSLISKVDGLSVVGPSILNWYKERYSWKNPSCSLRNIPDDISFSEAKVKLRDKFQIPQESILFLYQGLVGEGRGILELLEAFKALGPHSHLVIMGYGPLEETVLKKMSENVHWFDAVPQYEVLGYTVQADVGISLIENVCLSYYYSLPNKLFEYQKCGIPVIASNFPEMSSIINEFNSGWTVEPVSKEIVEFISTLTKEEIEIKRNNAINAKTRLDWHKEVKPYLEMIQTIAK